MEDSGPKSAIKRNTNLPEEKIDKLIETPNQQRYDEHDDDLCMLCHAYGADKRSLHISAFYRLTEFIPELIDLRDVEDTDKDTYYLRICKHCRAELFRHLKEWRKEAVDRRDKVKNHDGRVLDNQMGDQIYIRRNGESIPVTRQQYEKFKGEGDE